MGAMASQITSFITGGNRTMIAAATIVIMAAAKKVQQNVFALYHSYNRAILLGFIWILDFHFKIVPVLRRRYFILIRCNDSKRKLWYWRWLHHFDIQHWRWLHALMTMVALFRRVIFDTHTADPMQTNMHIGCMIVVRCDTCTISGAYAHLDCITSTMWDIGNRHSMQVTHSYKERMYHLFFPQLKTNCPACRTYEIATRFWVVVICPIIKCLTVLEFSFILFDLCLFITIFSFIWNYWIIYFLTCLEVFWSVVS